MAETPGPHTALLLKDMLGVSKPMIAAHLSVLERKGYITKRQSPEDKRVFFLTPAKKALALVADARTGMQAHLDALALQLGKDRFDTLVNLAAEANRAMESSRSE